VGQEVCEFLVRRGRQRLALISANDARARLRETSFLRAAATLGVRPPLVELVDAPATHASGRSALSAVLERSPDIDAVFCSSDMLALGVLTEARARGIAVPGDMAVIGFGDLDFAATLDPALTSVRIDGTELGRIAAGFIVDRAEGREVPDPVIDIGFTIVERESA
jgi:LacI family gluconate utilization system Gnt-I transcriptional repressor